MSGTPFPFSHLVVVHYHWRAGGVRRVVEVSLPAIVRSARGQLRTITLLSGSPVSEKPILPSMEIEPVLHGNAAFDYWQGNDVASVARQIRSVLRRFVSKAKGERTLIWFHNPALARNPVLCTEIAAHAATVGAGLIMHHHDFWCAGRWTRWRDLQAHGCQSLDEAAMVLFGNGSRTAQVTINLPDFQSLAPAFPSTAFHLPNPVERRAVPSSARHLKSGEWLRARVGTDAPIWLCPTRFLRRKNLLEAILLTRWLRPEALLATTSSQFSADEADYAAAVRSVAGRGVCLGLLDSPDAPRVPEILRHMEAVVLTSIQEGFGMGFVEAAAHGTPLIARALPDVMPDLEALGFHFPHLYDDVFVDPALFDASAESRRIEALLAKLRKNLPTTLRKKFSCEGHDLTRPVAFSRLTRQAQMEVLAGDPASSWRLCKRLNPALVKIRDMAARGDLTPSAWPLRQPNTPFGYAKRFWKIAETLTQTDGPPTNASDAQNALIRRALAADAFFPIQAQ
jgi:hypothetical protein